MPPTTHAPSPTVKPIADAPVRPGEIAIVECGWWESAAAAQHVPALQLRCAPHGDEGPYAAELQHRLQSGRQWHETFGDHPPRIMIDNGAAGLTFLEGDGGQTDLKLLHERWQSWLVSHFIDPLVTVAQGMPFGAFWQCLGSQTWIKAIWDLAQAEELTRFGVPSVVHLPMAAPDRTYDTKPLGDQCSAPAVSFVGAQNTSYYADDAASPALDVVPSAIAQAVQSDMGPLSFHEIYCDLYNIGETPSADQPLDQCARNAAQYYQMKLHYNAARCIRQRDRFVIFLKHQLGDDFQVVGRRWDSAYGIACQAPFDDYADYLNHFRRTPININLVNGNAESGLNMRHFEIAAAGGFMLCYHQPELESCFTVGKECDTFRTEKELLEKIRYYIAHADHRKQIAYAGQQRALNHHLYGHRLEALLQSLQQINAPAPRNGQTGAAGQDLAAPHETASPSTEPQAASKRHTRRYTTWPNAPRVQPLDQMRRHG